VRPSVAFSSDDHVITGEWLDPNTERKTHTAIFAAKPTPKFRAYSVECAVAERTAIFASIRQYSGHKAVVNMLV